MGRVIHLGEDVRHRLEEYLPGDSSDIPGNGRGAKSTAKILRLVTTPLEGYELLRRLRDDPQTSDVPVIVLTR